MRKLRSFLLAAFLFFAVLDAFSAITPSQAEGATNGLAECLVEVSSRRFLHEKNSEAKLPMASTTKILTAIIVIEDCDLNEIVVIPQAADGVEGSSVYLRAGERYSVRDLLYGLMLRSGNDCAVTLALHHSGSIEKFAGIMAVRANQMGAEHSSFANPHGLPDDKHFTTARDLALVSAYAMQNPIFAEIVSCKYYTPYGWKNKNKMLEEYDGASGIKTGFTTAAGRCLVSCATRNGMQLVCVLLNCPQTYERTTELFDESYASYQMIPLCNAAEPFEGYRIDYDFSYPLTQEELGEVRMESAVFLPLGQQKGDLAGQMLIYLKNSLLFSQNLYIM